jgi:peptidase M48-like protein
VTRTLHRHKLVLEVDNVLPQGAHGTGDGTYRPFNRRMSAIEEVLCCLPQEQYELWKSRRKGITWFVPETFLWGRVSDFPATKVLYLSPFLEYVQSTDTIIGLVAHEMAHFLLDHVGKSLSHDTRESAVRTALHAWGFSDEDQITERELFSFFSSEPAADKHRESNAK